MNLVEFARVRGVRVVPEFDAPAHVGEGWQWTDEHQAVVCFKSEPWQQYCVEPPCGQINPISNYAYTILQVRYSQEYYSITSSSYTIVSLIKIL